MTALLLDVGNTRLKWGVAERGHLRKTGNITRAKIREQGLGVLTSRLPRRVDKVMASNVAGASFATRLQGWLGAHCGCDVHFASSVRSACGVTNAYSQPRRMGVDRWVAVIGAWTEFRSSALIVDCGTAVTIDAVDDQGRHLGGQILPGISLMATALASETSDIPKVLPRKGAPDGIEVFATNTRDAVWCGSSNAVIGAIARSQSLLEDCGHAPTLVLTGGDAARILNALGTQAVHRPHLVLQGLMQLSDAGRHQDK